MVKLRILMIVKADVCLLGIPIVIAPEWVYSLFAVSLDAGGALAAMQYGASMIGNLLFTWFARNAAEWNCDLFAGRKRRASHPASGCCLRWAPADCIQGVRDMDDTPQTWHYGIMARWWAELIDRL